MYAVVMETRAGTKGGLIRQAHKKKSGCQANHAGACESQSQSSPVQFISCYGNGQLQPANCNLDLADRRFVPDRTASATRRCGWKSPHRQRSDRQQTPRREKTRLSVRYHCSGWVSISRSVPSTVMYMQCVRTGQLTVRGIGCRGERPSSATWSIDASQP